MSRKKTRTEAEKLKIMVDAQRNRELRARRYRERALKLFPWVCAHCGREFSGKRVRELTVHHKDHNHDNNPPDGSNWELLCMYCHDHEHSKYEDSKWDADEEAGSDREAPSTYRPFADLDIYWKKKQE